MLYINKPYITLLLLAVNATKHRLPRPSLASDRKSTRLNSSHSQISYAVFCLKKKKNIHRAVPPYLLLLLNHSNTYPRATTRDIQAQVSDGSASRLHQRHTPVLAK